MRVAPAGTATLAPTAAIRPSRIRTVAFAILGPETGYTVPPVIAIVWASRKAIMAPPGRSRFWADGRGRCGRRPATHRYTPEARGHTPTADRPTRARRPP